MGASRKKRAWFRVAQLLLIPIVIWLVWRSLAPNWPEIADAFATTQFRVGPLALSCAFVLVSYAVLIETWRRVVAAWGTSIPFGVAARIWFISNLAKWVPGRIWQITAMGALAHEAGVSPFAAVGSSLLIAVINILAGVAVVLLTASDALGLPQFVVILLGVMAIGVALIPRFLPAIARFVSARVGREVSWPALPYSTTIVAYLGCALAWVLYGAAFQLLVRATFAAASGATPLYIAVFTTSYIAGYIFVLMPGGLVVREASLGKLLTQYGMATVAGAAVIAIVSRVWLTVLELLPGLILLAFAPKRTPVRQ